jgi:hypothetical protein
VGDSAQSAFTSREEIGATTTIMAATNKCLAQGNKSSAAHEATNKRDTRPAPIRLDVSNETNSENKVHRTANCARDAGESQL